MLLFRTPLYRRIAARVPIVYKKYPLVFYAVMGVVLYVKQLHGECNFFYNTNSIINIINPTF